MEEDTLEDQLLFYAQEGSCSHIHMLLQSRIDQNTTSKISSGWTPLHLACYSGHRDVVEELLKPEKFNMRNAFAGRRLCELAE
uniref:Uncharacterized protein n=1 Tax=Stegastes partitus TaxID=144197 RepID=A0A3B5BCD1_9TELE